MSTPTVINLQPRKTGKHFSRSSRNERMVPAVIYGPKMENQNVLLDEIFVVKHRSPRFESTIFQTKSEDSKTNSLKVMLKSIQFHPATQRPVHVDLYALDMTATIKVNVQINFVGEPIGVKEEGGVLQTVRNEVEIECNPTEIPESIEVDISGMALNASMHVSEMTFPAGVKVITDAERTIATVSMPKEEKAEEAAPAEGEAPAEGAEAAPAEEKKD
ncbi:MAG: 50S ribosomal protein L25 [Bdellovibrionales bacterium]|nr:50S ribosomal protein L25 [Bdellovibrionales bacterium]NQZ18518.1 50S ribosomal protein L25 [Bdellovibrionales bacterium]